MNTKRVTAAAGVIHGSQKKGKQTATGLAADLESACMLQDPETAAEQRALRARVDEVERKYTFDTAELKRRIAELEAERHSTNEALSDAAETLRENRDRIAELEKAAEQIRFLHKDSPMGPCPVCVDADAMERGDDPTVPYPCPTARLAGAQDCDPPWMGATTGLVAPTQEPVEDVRPQVQKLRSLLAGQREAVDGEHYAAVHHSYRVGRDLPELGGTQ